MNTDFYFEIGHSHTICEDYALAGFLEKEKLSFAIVCDGCSASANTDVGARILAHSARKQIGVLNESLRSIKPTEFYPHILKDASETIKHLGIHPYCLDSTLLIAVANQNFVKLFLYGDGGVIIKKKNGDLEYNEIEFESGAPYYCSYFMNEERDVNYRREFVQHVKLTRSVIKNSLLESSSTLIDLHCYQEFYDTISFEASDVDFITLTSDGITTYEKKQENGNLDKVDVVSCVDMFADYKNFNGDFVERRMKRMRKDCEKENITHFDDISAATIKL